MCQISPPVPASSGELVAVGNDLSALHARPVQVGPFANPNEVYNFYSLPYCAPSELEFRREDLGALMKGDRATKTLYQLRFMGERLLKRTWGSWVALATNSAKNTADLTVTRAD